MVRSVSERAGPLSAVAAAAPTMALPLNWTSSQGVSTLSLACYSVSDLDLVAELLKSGADTSLATPTGLTPLHCACAGGDMAIVELLLRHHAQPGL